jgi:hypothetical protein
VAPPDPALQIDRGIWLAAAAIVHYLGHDADVRIYGYAADPRFSRPVRETWRLLGRAATAILNRSNPGLLH